MSILITKSSRKDIEMDKIELSKHVKRGDTFYTPFTDPNGMGESLSLSSWSKCWLPEFLWIALIIHEQGRKRAFENLYRIFTVYVNCNMKIHT